MFIDPRIADHITVRRAAPDLKAWRVLRVDYQDVDESGGNHNLYVRCLDEKGAPKAGVSVMYGFPRYDFPADTDSRVTNAAGTCDFGLYAMMPATGQGPYFVRCPQPSDVVEGMGLEGKQHVNFIVTYQLQEGNTQPDPTTPPSTDDNGTSLPSRDTVPSATNVMYARLAQALRIAASYIETM